MPAKHSASMRFTYASSPSPAGGAVTTSAAASRKLPMATGTPPLRSEPPTQFDIWLSHPVRREQLRRKLANMYHAATCKCQDSNTCIVMPHCTAAKRLYQHVCACKNSATCRVPGCANARKTWTHFGKCLDTSCKLCDVIPARPKTPLAYQHDVRYQRPPLSPRKSPVSSADDDGGGSTSSSSSVSSMELFMI